MVPKSLLTPAGGDPDAQSQGRVWPSQICVRTKAALLAAKARKVVVASRRARSRQRKGTQGASDARHLKGHERHAMELKGRGMGLGRWGVGGECSQQTPVNFSSVSHQSLFALATSPS